MYRGNTFHFALSNCIFDLQDCCRSQRFQSLTSLNFEFDYSDLLKGDSLREQVYKSAEWERVWHTFASLPHLRRVHVSLFRSGKRNGKPVAAESPNPTIGDSIFEPLKGVRKLDEFDVRIMWRP